MSSRPTLQRRFVRSMAVVIGATIALFVASSALLLHRTIHQQTDSMLTALAETEAHGALSEYAQGVHVHETGISLPSLAAHRAEKFSAALDANCRVVASTTNIAGDVPDGFCELHHPRVTDIAGLADTPLRVATWPTMSPDGSRYIFIAGVRHSRIDRAVFLTILVYGLLALVLGGVILGAIAGLSKRLSRDLEHLSEACDELGDEPVAAPEGAFDISENAPHEISNLATTIDRLLRRWSEVVDLQSEFFAVASHELRTPLTAMKGDIEVTLRRERNADEYREALERVLGDVERLSALSSRLLETARTRNEALTRQTLNLAQIVDDSMARNLSLLEQSGMTWEAELDELSIQSDPTALSRILDNLLGNAAEHSSADHLKVWAERRSSFVELHIADDGIGVPGEVSSDLLAPLRPGGSNAQRGLGLYISARLAERLGGSLRLQHEDAGAHWILSLPRRG